MMNPRKKRDKPAPNYPHYSDKTPRTALQTATCSKGALPRLPAQQRLDSSCSVPLLAGIFCYSSITVQGSLLISSTKGSDRCQVKEGGGTGKDKEKKKESSGEIMISCFSSPDCIQVKIKDS